MTSTSHSTAIGQQQQQQQSDPQCAPLQCTPRLTFWIVAGASWLAWMFAVREGLELQQYR